MKVWDRVGIGLTTPGSADRFASVARQFTDCATRPGSGWMDDWMDGMDGWMDEWIDGWMDGWMEPMKRVPSCGRMDGQITQGKFLLSFVKMGPLVMEELSFIENC